MIIDHVGYLFFPKIEIFRIIGRLAFPLFAFMVAEGCKYTRNKLKYFLSVFSLGVICQVVYYLFSKSSEMYILITLSFSILIIYLLQYLKKCLLLQKCSLTKRVLVSLSFICSIIALYFINKLIKLEYGFWGVLLAVFASIFKFDNEYSEKIKRLDNKYICIGVFMIGLIFLAISINKRQYYSFLSIPLLLLYSGKRGKYNIKYFFYLAYPLHFVVLEGIYLLIR